MAWVKLFITKYDQEQVLCKMKECDENSFKTNYNLITSEIVWAIREDELEYLKDLLQIVRDIQSAKRMKDLFVYNNDPLCPIRNTNLIILSCKYNKLKILEYILSDEGLMNLFCNKNVSRLDDVDDNGHNLFCNKNVSRLDDVDDNGHNLFCNKNVSRLDDVDDNGHNAFYYALRWNNLELIEQLSKTWTTSKFNDLEKVLCKTYEEIKLKCIPIKDELQFYVENKIIEMNLCLDEQNIKDISIICSVEERITLIQEVVRTIIQNDDNKRSVDSKLLFNISFLVKNLYILKKQMNSSYARLPWEEIEFCLVLFVISYSKMDSNNIFYRTILNKKQLLKHLRYFSEKLDSEKSDLKNVGKRLNFALKRKDIITNIKKSSPKFESLYEDFNKCKDIYSLDQMVDHIELSLSMDTESQQGRLAVIRCLQLVGEYLKCTVDSPNLSEEIAQQVLLSVPLETREVLKNVRDALSHSYSLTKRTEMEEKNDLFFYKKLMSEMKEIKDATLGVVYRMKISTLQSVLEGIINNDNIEETLEMIRVLKDIDFDHIIMNLKYIETKRVDQFIEDIKKIIGEKNVDINLRKIDDIIKSKKGNTIKDCKNFKGTVEKLKSFTLFIDLTKSDLADMIKSLKSILDTLYHTNCWEDTNVRAAEKSIVPHLFEIFHRYRDTLEVEDLLKLFEKITSTLSLEALQTDNIVCLNNLQEKIHEKRERKKKSTVTKNIPSSQNNEDLLKERKEILEKFTVANRLSKKELCLDYSFYKEDKILQFAVEILLLDILSLSGEGKKTLDDNTLLLDESVPSLIGKNLRIHLAHGNILQNILPSTPQIAIVSCAIDIKTSEQEGRICKKSYPEIKRQYDESLKILELQNSLLKALTEGCLSDLIKSIDNGGDIFFKTKNDSRTAVHFAAKGPNVDVLKYLIDRGIKIEIKDIYGQSPLHIAAEYGTDNVVEYLIQVGLKINEMDNYFRTPLHIATINNNEDVVKFLSNNNADSSKDINGFTPMHYAIQNKNINIVKILFKKEESINRINNEDNFLHCAANVGSKEIIEFLLEMNLNVNAKNQFNETPLHVAVTNGYKTVVEILIKNGAYVDAVDLYKETVLHCAVKNGNESIVELLIKNPKVDLNIKNNTMYTPLHVAAEEGKLSIVKMLVKADSDIDVLNLKNETPLLLSAGNGHFEIVNYLFSNEASIELRDVNRNTPLHRSSLIGNEDIVRVLLNSGSKADSVNLNGDTPFHYAVIGGNFQVVKMLSEETEVLNMLQNDHLSALHLGIETGHREIIKFLIDKCNVNIGDGFALTPLHLAAKYPDKHDIVTLLIDANANIDGRNNTGSTPLHIAIVFNNFEAAKTLIQKGADKDAINESGYIPLFIAIATNQMDITKLLIDNKADLGVSDKTGLAPLTVAIQYNKKDFVKILIDGGADINAGNGQALGMAVQLGLNDIVKDFLKRENIFIDPLILHQAAYHGSVTIVNELLNKGIQVDCINECGYTALYPAIMKGNKNIVQLLLENGADPNIPHSTTGTLLNIAILSRNIDIIKLLKTFGAEDNLTESIIDPFLLSLYMEDLEVTKILKKEDSANINIENSDGATALHIVAHRGNVEKIKYLISEGANIHARDSIGCKPIHVAIKRGHKDAVECFINGGISIEEVDLEKKTLLHYAASGSIDMVQYIIDKGVDVNICDATGVAPIHMSAFADVNSLNIIKVLLRNGAIYNPSDNSQLKPEQLSNNLGIINLFTATKHLFTAIKHEFLSEVQDSIALGAFVDALNVDYVSPLHLACWKGNKAIVEYLLSNGANLNVRGKGDSRPLHYAAKYGHTDIVVSLLSNGAIYDILDANGKSPQQYAEVDDIKNILSLVHNSFEGIKKNKSDILYSIETIEEQSRLKMLMNARNKENKSLTIFAIYNKYKKIDKLIRLLRKKINILNEFCGETLNILRSSLKMSKEIFHKNDPIVLGIKLDIAKLFEQQTEYKRSLDIAEEIYSVQKDMFPDDNIFIIRLKKFRASLYKALGRHDDALQIIEEIYRTVTLGTDHEFILDLQNEKAILLSMLRRYDEANKLNYEIIDKLKRIYGECHIKPIIMLNNIAVNFIEQEEYEKALDAFKQVYDFYEKSLGFESLDTLKVKQNMAGVYFKKRKFKKALELTKEVYKIQMRVYGPNHYNTLITKIEIIKYFEMDDVSFQDKLKVSEDGFDTIDRIIGPDHPHVLISKEVVMNVYQQLGKDHCEEYLRNIRKELFEIIRKGDDAEALKDLLDSGMNVNTVNSEGITPLHFAINYNNVEIVKILLEYGADISKTTKKGNSSLHTAVTKGNEELVQILLEHARDIEYISVSDFTNLKTLVSGSSSLHIAVKNNRVKIVKLLLENGACYECLDKDKKTPANYSTSVEISNVLSLVNRMFELVKYKNMESIVQYRKSFKDDIRIFMHAKNINGQVLTELAYINGFKEFVQWFLELYKETENKNLHKEKETEN